MKILFVGDVMLGRLVNEALKKLQPSYVWGDTLSIFNTANLRICNLECVISDIGEPWSITPKVFHFRTDSKNVDALKIAGVDPVSIANNHTLDYGYEALFQMMKILGDNAINYAGAGANIQDASMPAVCEINKKKIGFIAFTDNEPDWEATETKPGIYYVPIDLTDARAINLFKNIKRTKKDLCDLLIVSAHWGPNWGYHPPPEHVPFAHKLIDSGADVIFGHSGHVFRGIEIYKGKPIIYCAGNFIDDYAIDEIERNDQSFIFVLEIEREKFMRLLLYPTLIKDFQAILAKGTKAEEIASKMKDLCLQFKTHHVIWQKKKGRIVINLEK